MTSADDAAHKRAIQLSNLISPDKIVTTDEVLCEYLAFFASARPALRDAAGLIVSTFWTNKMFMSFRRLGSLFWPDSDFIAPVPTKDIVSPTVFPWKRCARKD